MSYRGKVEEHLYIPRPAVIKKIQRFTEKEKLFTVELSDGLPLNHTPGQFVEVSIFGFGEAPISVSSPPDEMALFELCVREVGSLTAALHKLEEGAPIGIRGPFGNGFDTVGLKGKDLLFIAGGIGLAPLRSLIKSVIHEREEYGNVTILYGVKNPQEILFPEEITSWEKMKGLDFQITVDEADSSWHGNVGVVTALIPSLELDAENTTALVVGPPIMYKYVLLSLRSKGIPGRQIIVSLERRMKCGVGKCGHCQMDSVYVCQEGPVFNCEQIQHMKEAIH